MVGSADELMRLVERRANAISITRPYVLLTYAQSLDGSIAPLGGSSKPSERLILSGPASLALTHGLRHMSDAVCVGIGTVIADNPRLSVRLDVSGRPFAPSDQPAAVIFDSTCRCPLDSTLVRAARSRRVFVVSARDDAALREAGCEIIVAATMVDALQQLWSNGIRKLMIEGGATIISSVIDQRLADDLIVTIAPCFVGGLKPIPNPLSLRLHQPTYLHAGPDIVVFAQFLPPDNDAAAE